MTISHSHDSKGEEPRESSNWAQTSTFRVSHVPTGALHINVDGRSAVGPLQGFGQLWKRTYQLYVPCTSRLFNTLALGPEPGEERITTEVMRLWKANFVRFQPPDNRFYPIGDGIEPGQVILINTTLTGIPLPTGVVVLYADEKSFSLMTPQGHPESGWVTFSTYMADGDLICEVQSLARANDPLYEIGFRLFGSRVQEQIWAHVLKALAAYLHVDEHISISKQCVDPSIRWLAIGNIWQNAALRSMLYILSTPLRRLRSQ